MRPCGWPMRSVTSRKAVKDAPPTGPRS